MRLLNHLPLHNMSSHDGQMGHAWLKDRTKKDRQHGPAVMHTFHSCWWLRTLRAATGCAAVELSGARCSVGRKPAFPTVLPTFQNGFWLRTFLPALVSAAAQTCQWVHDASAQRADFAEPPSLGAALLDALQLLARKDSLHFAPSLEHRSASYGTVNSCAADSLGP